VVISAVSQSTFYNPVRLLSGPGCFAHLGERAAQYGSCTLIVTGRQAMQRTGWLQRAMDLLEQNGVSATVFQGARPNPTAQGCREAGALAREQECDLVIGLGGGSAMDTAKAAAVVATHDRDVVEFLQADPEGHKPKPTGATLPLLCVTSTAGTSSQLTPFAVISAEEILVKTALAGEALFPRVAFCDPELAYSIPARVTAATGVDVLCHSLEAYFSQGASPVTDLCAEQAIALVTQYLPRAVLDGSDKEARWAMTRADVFAGYALSNCGGTIIHAIEHPLSAHYPELPHGEGLAALMPAYAHVFWQEAPERFARLTELLGAPVSGLSAEAAAQQLEPVLVELLEKVGLRLTLTELGAQPDRLEAVVQGTLARMPIDVDESHVRAMVELSL